MIFIWFDIRLHFDYTSTWINMNVQIVLWHIFEKFAMKNEGIDSLLSCMNVWIRLWYNRYDNVSLRKWKQKNCEYFLIVHDKIGCKVIWWFECGMKLHETILIDLSKMVSWDNKDNQLISIGIAMLRVCDQSLSTFNFQNATNKILYMCDSTLSLPSLHNYNLKHNSLKQTGIY